MASTAGNICTSISTNRPMRRPRKCKRLNANAAHAPMSKAPNEFTVQMINELPIHFRNGHWSLFNNVSKLAQENVVGMTHEIAERPDLSLGQAPLNELLPENARFTRYPAGNSAQMQTITAIRCRQPTTPNHRPIGMRAALMGSAVSTAAGVGMVVALLIFR